MCFLFPFCLSVCLQDEYFPGLFFPFVFKQQQWKLLQHFIQTTFGKICYKEFKMSIDSSSVGRGTAAQLKIQFRRIWFSVPNILTEKMRSITWPDFFLPRPQVSLWVESVNYGSVALNAFRPSTTKPPHSRFHALYRQLARVIHFLTIFPPLWICTALRVKAGFH